VRRQFDTCSVPCEVLDVPVVVAAGLARRYGYGVWLRIVTNQNATLCGEMATHTLLGARDISETSLWEAVMRGLDRDVPGVRDAVAKNVASPDWLVKMLLDRKMLHEEQQLALVRSERSTDSMWYLAYRAPLLKRVRAEARRRYDALSVVRRDVANIWPVIAKHAVVWSAGGGVWEGNERWLEKRSLPHHHNEWSLQLAKKGRQLLGDGTSSESLATWERFFELVESRVSEDIEGLIDAGARVMERVV
jgi:hypothetical protein